LQSALGKHWPEKQGHLMADIPAPQYPTNQSQPTQSLATMNPLQVIAAANYAQQFQNTQRTMASQQATGEAFQGALQDDGSLDMGKLSAALQNNPAAAYGMPDTAQKMLTQGSGQFDLDAARNKFVVDAVGSVANDPKLNADKVRSLGVTLARNLKIPSHMINNWLDDMPKDQAGIRSKLIQMRNIATGSANASTPTPSGLDDAGAPVTAPRDVYNYKTAGGGIPSALAPGEQGLSESAAGRAANLQATASSSPQYHADLENLRQDSAVMGNLGGPTQDVEKKLNQLSTRVAGFGITMTPDQLRASESFDKVASQIALNQAKMLGGTDSTRSMTVGATPNSGMSRYGRDGVIDMLQGNQDSVDAAREAWLDARSKGAPAGSHDLFMNKLNKVLDPRVFQFNRLTPENKQKFLSQMPPQDIPSFEAKYKASVARGWVPPLKPAAQQ
jgi:hypothetical protein